MVTTEVPDYIDIDKVWKFAKHFAVAKFGTSVRTDRYASPEDLVGVAGESLTNALRTFPEWCEQHSVEPSEALFWSHAKQKINWDTLKYLERKISYDSSIFADLEDNEAESPEYVRTQLRLNLPHSMLHTELVSVLAKQSVRDRLLLALVCFEEIPVGHVALMLGDDTHTTTSVAVKRAAKKFLLNCLDRVLEGKPARRKSPAPKPYEVEPGVARWLKRAYGVPVTAYLSYVEANYRADVSYLIEILDRATGATHFYRANRITEEKSCGRTPCKEKVIAKGLCARHYAEARRNNARQILAETA